MGDSPLIVEARYKQPELSFGDAVHVELDDLTRGKLGVNNVVVVCPPVNIKDKALLESTLEKTYDQLFQLNSKVTKGAENTLLVPCFSIGRGGVTPEMSAKVAVEKAKKYIEENPNAFVQFVFFNDSKGKKAHKAYREALGENADKRIEFVDGDITKLTGDTLVMPVRENYQVGKSGPTAIAIDKLAKKRFEPASEPVNREIEAVKIAKMEMPSLAPEESYAVPVNLSGKGKTAKDYVVFFNINRKSKESLENTVNNLFAAVEKCAPSDTAVNLLLAYPLLGVGEMSNEDHADILLTPLLNFISRNSKSEGHINPCPFAEDASSYVKMRAENHKALMNRAVFITKNKADLCDVARNRCWLAFEPRVSKSRVNILAIPVDDSYKIDSELQKRNFMAGLFGKVPKPTPRSKQKPLFLSPDSSREDEDFNVTGIGEEDL